MRAPPLEALLLAALVAFGPAVARAQPATATSNAAAADELFDRGKELLRAGDWPAACAKFQASMDLDPSVGARLKIARCHEHEGKLTLALDDYHQALVLNRALPHQTDQRRAELDAYTNEALAALERRVPRVRVRVLVPSPPRDLVLTVGGRGVPASALGEELPADPGPLEIVAGAPGYVEARRIVELRESEVQEVELPLVPAPARPRAPSTYAGPPQSAASRPARAVGFALLGAGAVQLGVAGVLGLQTGALVRQASPDCTSTFSRCTPAGADTLSQARVAQAAAFVSLGLGAAAAIAGVTLILIAPARREAGALAAHVGPGSIALGGTL